MKYASLSIPEDGILLIDYHSIEPTEAEFDEYLKETEEFMMSHNHNVVIMDGTESKFLPAKLRIKQGEWMKKNFEFLKKNSPLNIFVIPNPIVKMIMRGIFVVQKPPTDYKVVGTREEALNLARKHWEANPEQLATAC